MDIFCCGCNKVIDARLTDGSEIYPHRDDLYHLPFWKCDVCGNDVGCHHKTNDRTKPLGHISTPEIKKARQHIHSVMDPLWQDGLIKRKALYQKITDKIGWRYHTAKIRSVDEARKVYRLVVEISAQLNN